MEYYKAFGKDLKCKGFQYEVGKEYQIEGEEKERVMKNLFRL